MIHLITGGAGSGKSAYAESLIIGFGEGRRIYIATMDPGNDPENEARIERHRAMRAGIGFETIECLHDLASVDIPNGSIVLIDCLSNLAANEMFRADGAGEKTVEAVTEGLSQVGRKAAHTVIVTNEIFSDGFHYDQMTATYQEYLGRINRNAAQMADAVTEVVYGIPVPLKRP
ncbi:MAG: bifunctional adenosylcobinamide kinase/adenosylcobinamide-phosphate guanylyltransferase [Eubacterium sp.]|nr:bifunctional adenosylcobinamide kinase/adenosylcobinamide-phosphate guanylyltransferase [Eubacterium sp.]